MKKIISFLVAVAVTVFSANSFADTITTETPVYLGTSAENVGNWGTAYSAVKLDEYRNGNSESKTGLWKQRFDALTGYLNNTLGSNQMTTDSTIASASKSNYGLISTKSHKVEYHSASDGGMGTSDLNAIYGQRANSYADNSQQSTNGYNQLIREGSMASAASAYDSTAALASAYENTTSIHSWSYDADSDSWTGSKSNDKKSIDDHGMGIYAFVTGFVYDPESTLEYLNGWFSVLGNLEDVLLNGKSLLESDYYWTSGDVNDSKWFDSYDFELNLEKLFANNLLNEGNNNIAFVVDSYPAEVLLGMEKGKFTDGNDSLIGFAADVWKTDTSIVNPPPAATPEPATILIFGLGLAGLGLRRRFTKKG
jgi:hypothetical protein